MMQQTSKFILTTFFWGWLVLLLIIFLLASIVVGAYDIGEDNTPTINYREVTINNWDTINYWQRYSIVHAINYFRDYHNKNRFKRIILLESNDNGSSGWSEGNTIRLYNFYKLSYTAALCLTDHELTEEHHPRPIKGPNHSWNYIFETCGEPLPSNNERFK